jgi:protein-L-isoaspartate(D-aspartate) O-methyltransferase
MHGRESDMDAVSRSRHKLVESVFQNLGYRDVELERIMKEIPRHLFVDSAQEHDAYKDIALPIGFGQTISQPTMVAIMTHELAPRSGDKILEIGTGSGYQTAILAYYTPRLYTVERLADLSRRAQGLLEQLGLRNVIYKIGDGSMGWESWSPYDRILVAAGAPAVSETLKRQLADGGRMVIPTGGRETQRLLRIERRGDVFEETDLGDCRFVPLLGTQGFK